MPSYVLKNICNCDTTQQMRTLEIRNSDAVRLAMYSDHEISTNEHLIYIEDLRSSEKAKVFLVLDEEGTAVGAASLSSIDAANKRCDWAFYLSPEARGGLGSAIEITMIDHVFQTLAFEKLNCEVLETNPRVVEMHERFGFQKEGFRPNNIAKGAQRIGVHYMGLSASDWRANRSDRIAKLNLPDGISITFEDTPTEALTFIDSIQKARARNNVNWMALLRLSVEKHPHLSKPIIAEIMKIDAEINELTQGLVSDVRKNL